MRFSSRRTLVLAAHTDDEFGCAGLIGRLVEQGTEVHVACFSWCEESVPEGYERDVLKAESRAAMTVLGVAPERFRLRDFRVRHFPSFRQEILEELVVLRREIDPDLVLLPSSDDIHQDHGVIAQEGIRAFKHSTILGYELPMNTISFRHACFVPLDERHMELKIAHAACYASQQHRPYMHPDFLRSLGFVRGVQINRPAAEAFEVIRMVAD
ncbi:MAG TPA: PIG-L deacetylase family protein [Candidatus Deferrimicrobium sp.]|nr:PIG-L deacetylase family protein [Candidatus Deferrimicrobium sp.]